MDRNDNGEYSGVGRRQVLRSLGAVGVGAGLTGIAGASGGDSVTVTVVAGRDGPALQRRVPRAWYERVSRTRDQRDRLRAQFADDDAVMDVGVEGLDQSVAGMRTTGVVVNARPDAADAALDRVADRATASSTVPVRTQRAPETELTYNESDFDPVPAGVTMEGWTGGTSGWLVDYDGSEYLMSAAHLFYDYNDNFSSTGYQNGRVIGPAGPADRSQDWVMVTTGSGTEVSGLTDVIEGESGSIAGTESGYVTESGLDTLIGDNTTVYQMGTTTGKTSGTVEAYDQSRTNTSGHDKYDQVKCSIPVDGGDSGGPIFHQYSSGGCTYNALIGIQSSGDDRPCSYCNYQTAYAGQAFSIRNSAPGGTIYFDARSYPPCY